MGLPARRHARVSLLLVLVLLPALPVRAQISGATNGTTGATCDGAFPAFGDCVSSAAFVTSTATSFTSRHGWNINTDTDSYFMPSSIEATAQHNIAFNVTAPGGYRLEVVTRRVGEFGRFQDALTCGGSADTSGVTGAASGGVLIGSLNLPDPGVLSGDATVSVPFSQQSGTAAIFGVSNGVAQSHTLTFTWDGAVHSNTCQVSIRQGENTVRTCQVCPYPGNPPRTQADDGHFVTVNLVSLCGNGGVDGMVGEQCDLGPSNGAAGSCCTSTCRFRTAGQVCRASTGACDAAETCTGSTPVCPANALLPSSTVCRASAGTCDVAETCTGSGVSCPADTVASAGTVCRGIAGGCDVPETCSGSSPACPVDAFVSSLVTCRASAGPCDVAEQCTGSSATCPADAFVSASTVCRAAAGTCDVAEHCTGGDAACPTDGFAPPGSACRPAAGPCDAAETCDGTNAPCPADAREAAGTTCRQSADACDVAETCDGTSSDCPPDALAPDGTSCDDGQTCSAPDTCQAGVCAGPIDIGSCVGNFLCYKARATSPFARIAGVHLVDELDDGVFDVVKPKQLCTPAGETSDEILDASTHLRGYQIRRTGGATPFVRRTAIAMTNQLGTIVLDALSPDLLLVPAATDPGSSPLPPNPSAHGVDHYTCYKTRVSSGTPKLPRGLQIVVGDQRTSPAKRFDLKKVRHLCLPVDKNGEGIRNPAGKLVCYQAKPAAGQPKHQRSTAFVHDQFGPGTLTTIKEDELCIPSLAMP